MGLSTRTRRVLPLLKIHKGVSILSIQGTAALLYRSSLPLSHVPAPSLSAFALPHLALLLPHGVPYRAILHVLFHRFLTLRHSAVLALGR